MKSLLSDDPADPIWNANLVPTGQVLQLPQEPPLSDLVLTALRNRPEIEQLRQQRAAADVNLHYAQNQTKPQVDLQAGYASNGFAGNPTNPANSPFTASSAQQLMAINALIAAVNPTLPVNQQIQDVYKRQEKKMLAGASAAVIHNPVTNQYLGDGICDVAGLLELGVPVGLGTDANINASILDEMRAAAFLQKLAHHDAGAFDAVRAFRLGTSLGAQALGIDAGDFRASSYADYAVIDLERLNPPASPLINALIYRARSRCV